jgi:hypothetical protein
MTHLRFALYLQGLPSQQAARVAIMGRATASIRAFLCSRTWATHILDVEAVGRYYGVEQKTMELSAVQGNLTLSFNIPPFDWLELQDLVMDHAAGRRLEERLGYKTWSAQFTSEVAGWVTAARPWMKARSPCCRLHSITVRS